MSWLLSFLVIGFVSWAMLDGVKTRQGKWLVDYLVNTYDKPTNHRVFVAIRNDMDLNYYEEIEVTNNLGASNYIRLLDGLLSEVDGSKGYWVDHFDADQEHLRIKLG